MKISIIVLAWIRNQEHYDLTVNTINSLAATEDLGDSEFIVVDNGSVLGGDMLQKSFKVCIKNQENKGYPKGVNQGVALATGDLIAIANNDIRVSPNWAKVTREAFDKLPKQGHPLGSLHFKMVGYNEPFNTSDGVWTEGRERWCHGSFFVWSRMAITKLSGYKTKQRSGPLDEGYGLGGFDDYDWQFRMRARKLETAYTNGAAFQHKDSSTLNTLESGARSESDKKNREYFKSKFGEYPDVMWNEKYKKQLKRDWKPFP